MPVAVRAVGTEVAGTSNITVNYPTRSNNDILLLFAETAANQPITTVTAGAGGGTWTQILGSGTSDSVLNIWWSRWTTGQASSLTITDTGDHQVGAVISLSGCVTTGTPYEDLQTLAFAGGGFTSVDIPSVTTTYNNTLIVGAATTGRDGNSSTEFSGYTNSNLINITERIDEVVNTGNGGGFCVFTGFWTEVGACGETAVTLANPTNPMTAAFAMIGTDSTLPHIGWGMPI